MKIILFLLSLIALLHAKIDLYKFEHKDANATLFVIGGIHGNEPGGYFAPAILTQYYTIKSNNLWVIPNLNKASIMANKRGVHGDMNRKFATIKPNDKDKKIVQDVKKLITNKQVSLILNLHDGHGFYRKKYNSTVFNPNAWGQSCVIDQCKINLDNAQKEYKDLKSIATRVTKNINKRLLEKHHKFHVKNTKTKFDDEAMQLSLTYYAVTNNKPAFAIETSKNLSTVSQKVFYQLLAIEEFMKIMHIDYERHFQLNSKGINKILKEYGSLNINNNISLDLVDIKKHLSYIPLKSSKNQFKFSHPLGMIKKTKKGYDVYVGNKILTTLKPQIFHLAKCSQEHKLEVDGKILNAKYNSEVVVKNYFKIKKDPSVRVNVIGFSKKGYKDESELKVTLKDLAKRYSLDKHNKKYRVEFYKKDKFCSMIVVHFK